MVSHPDGHTDDVETNVLEGKDADSEEVLKDEELELDQEESDDVEESEVDEEKKTKSSKTTSGKEFADRDMDATRLYLSEIGFSPLLTAQEEVYYSRRAQKGDAASRARMASKEA